MAAVKRYATAPAMLCRGMDGYPDTAKRRAAAAKLAEKTAHSGTIADVDTAAVIYNTVREKHPEDILEFLLASVFAAGIERGREREKARQRREARKASAP